MKTKNVKKVIVSVVALGLSALLFKRIRKPEV